MKPRAKKMIIESSVSRGYLSRSGEMLTELVTGGAPTWAQTLLLPVARSGWQTSCQGCLWGFCRSFHDHSAIAPKTSPCSRSSDRRCTTPLPAQNSPLGYTTHPQRPVPASILWRAFPI